MLFCRSGFDFQFRPTAVHRFGHAAHGFHFLNDRPSFFSHLIGERFHHVATGPWVHHVGDVGLFLNDELGIAGDARAEFCWQGNRFVKRIGVQALRAPEHGSHGLNRSAHHIVVRVLLGQAPAAGLAMGAQHK